MTNGEFFYYTKLNGCTVLHCAVQKNAPIAFIQKLIRSGADPNSRDNLMLNSPLHYAVRDRASAGIVKLLLESGAAVDAEGMVSLFILALMNSSVGELIKSCSKRETMDTLFKTKTLTNDHVVVC
jgi:ankyrin repeat protein